MFTMFWIIDYNDCLRMVLAFINILVLSQA